MRILTVLSLVIFFAYAVYALTGEGITCYKTFKKLNSLSDTQKKNYVIGDLHAFAAYCNRIIPEDAHILFLSNLFNNKKSYDLLLSYYLYPRKLYWLNNINPYPESPPELNDLDHGFLSRNNIEWVIVRYPEDHGINTLVKLEQGTPVQSFSMNPARGEYSTP